MQTFEELYHGIIRPINHDTLYKRELMNDTEVLKFAYLLAHFKQKSPSQLSIIDPATTDTIRRFHARNQEASQYMKEMFLSVPLILMPICDDVHWSLLYHRRGTNHWVHMDSLAPLHATFAQTTLTQLRAMGLTTSEKMVTFIDMPRQRSYWECGTFTLLYMLTVMLFDDAEIQHSIDILSEERRQKLTKYISDLTALA
jgi:Ulp1 family protease